jgi:quercetin dioxygenase-like cupin family protein
MAAPLTNSSMISDPAAGPALSRSAAVNQSEMSNRSGAPGGTERRTKKAMTMTSKLFALVLLCLMTGAAMAEQAKVTSLMSKELTDNPGKEVLMITVDYPPGSSDPIHRHNAQAFVYVLEGSIVMQVKGGKEVTLTPGQTFYEGPNDIHVVGRNASSTKPAKFVVFMIKDKGAPVFVPVE